VKSEHYPIFDCAIGERAIHYMGHVKMMGAVQPFISGAISKTVNMPEEVTVEDVMQLYIDAWKLGTKAIAIYRDNCKVAQPLSGKAEDATGLLAAASAPAAAVAAPRRRRLPDDRVEVGRKFQVGDYEGYIHVGLYEDGTPGDIFVDIAKEGTTLAGLMNSFMIAVSLGLQYGAPRGVHLEVRPHALRAERPDERRRHPSRQVDRRLRVPLDGQALPRCRPAGGNRHPERRGEGAPSGRLCEWRHGRSCCGACRSGRGSSAGPDSPVQRVGGRGRVLALRRSHGPHGQLLHVPRLRNEHRLLVSATPTRRSEASA
jgi:ribonucleotide reductase alpha subunit